MAESTVPSLSSAITENIHSIWNITELRPHQKEAIASTIMLKQDCIINVPTGFGKSLCYETLTTAYQWQFAGSGSETESVPSNRPINPLVLVVSPLLSLMNSQADSLNNRGIEAVSLGECSTAASLLLEGKFRYVT